MARRQFRPVAMQATALAVCLVLTACGASGDEPATEDSTSADSTTASATPSGSPVPTVDPDLAVDAPKTLDKPLLSSDLLVLSDKSLDEGLVESIGELAGVTHTEVFSLGQFFHEETGVTYAAVDPASFRRLTPPGTAQTLQVWQRVAGGEMAINPELGRRIEDDQGYIKVGAGEDAPSVHVGAYANLTDPQIAPMTRIDAVVNQRWVKSLRMKKDNAMIVSMGSRSPQSILPQLRRLTGKDATVQILGPNVDPSVAQIAIPTGGSVAAAIGAFRYTVRGGTVIPEARWVSENIRTETLPVVGQVRCHKVMLNQLRMVMLEIQRVGRAKSIYDYGGCYVPRYIAGKSTLSNHSFGTAIDLNVQDNLRGVPGKMDRTVVEIFKRFGFDWGGDWSYTDPMHFELARLVKQG